MPYMTFGPDMRAEGGRAKKCIKDIGKVVVKNIRDPFAMFCPLCEGVAQLGWCCARMMWYVLRWVWG